MKKIAYTLLALLLTASTVLAGVMLGDANGDGAVDVADITTIAAEILGNSPKDFNRDNADVNKDGSIDVADITGTAGIILGTFKENLVLYLNNGTKVEYALSESPRIMFDGKDVIFADDRYHITDINKYCFGNYQSEIRETTKEDDEELGTQILIFNSSGEVNLFYSSKLDSIVCYDDEITSLTQTFYTKDTVQSVPVAQIDSVTFGNRNISVMYDDVKVLTDETDIPYITRGENNTLYYKSSTPAAILPKVGEKIYYEGCKDLIPHGVAAKVISVSNSASEIAVVLSAVDIQEIFEKLFYAGDIKEMPENIKKFIRKGNPKTLSLGVNIDAESYGSISANGSMTFNGSAIVDIFRHYYKVDASLDFDIDFGMTLSADECSSLNLEKKVLSVDLPTIYGVIKPTISLSGFLDLDADLSFKYNLTKHYSRRVIWERNNGVNTWQFPNDKDSDDGNTTAKTDLTLNGSVFFGPAVTLDFHVIGDFVGARAKIKAGPEISGEISMGMLQDVKTYDPTFYGKADLDANMKLSAETFLLNKERWIWGDEVETKLLSFEYKWLEHKLHLFPEFEQTKSVAAASTDDAKSQIISNATKTNTDVERAVEVGFQVIDKNESVIDSVFVDYLPAHTENVQGFKTEMPVNKNINTKDMFVRPVFHYAGYTIPFDKVGIKDDIQIQPSVFAMTNAGVRILSGYPFTGSVVSNSTLYTAGPYQQYYKRDTVYVKDNPAPTNNASYIYEIGNLIGTWKGQDIVLVFNEDMTAKFNDNDATYKTNYPQTGDISIILIDGPAYVYSLVNLTASTMQLYYKKEKTTIKLERQ